MEKKNKKWWKIFQFESDSEKEIDNLFEVHKELKRKYPIEISNFTIDLRSFHGKNVDNMLIAIDKCSDIEAKKLMWKSISEYALKISETNFQDVTNDKKYSKVLFCNKCNKETVHYFDINQPFGKLKITCKECGNLWFDK